MPIMLARCCGGPQRLSLVTAMVALAAAMVCSWADPAFANHVEPNDFAPEQEAPIGAKPADPQPGDGDLSGGLAVRYWDIFARDIKEIADLIGRRKAKPGTPLAKLDYKAVQGNVLTSGRNDGVGAEIEGYIRFDRAGTYRFVANSNDGIRVTVAGELLFEDPDVHADQMTNWAEVNVTQPGWYDLYVLYFERKNRSTLQLFWKVPGADDYTIVPESAFAHKGK